MDVTSDHLEDTRTQPTGSGQLVGFQLPGFEILRELGRGGMGVVYHARQTSLNREVALKTILRADLAGSAEVVRFYAEAEAVASIHHPHIVQVFEFGEHNGNPYLVMEFLPGGTLANYLAHRQLTPRAAAELFEPIVRGVAAAHEVGIVHRDLKPTNILFDAANQPKVVDFGLAKRSTATEMTASGAVLGTPSYMAPEQAAGRTKLVGPEADVWALGVMLYEAVAKRRPFEANSTLELLALVQTAEPPRLQQVPRDFRTIVERCLTREPDRRYSTATALADELKRFLNQEPILARPVGSIERFALWVRRKPTLATIYALILLALILVGFGTTLANLWQQAEYARQQALEQQGETELARVEAVRQRQLADQARDRLAMALKATEEARDRERDLRQQLDNLAYLSTMDLAFQSFEKQPIAYTQALLADCTPALRNWEWYYLDQLTHPEKHVLTPTDFDANHAKLFYFTAAVFNRNSQRLLASGMDGKLRVWDLKTGQQVATKETGSSVILDLSISQNGKSLLLNCPGMIRVWDAETLSEHRAFPYPTNEFHRGWCSPDGSEVVLSSDQDSELRVIGVSTGVLKKTYKLPVGEQTWAVGFVNQQLRAVTLERREANDLRPAAVRVHDVEAGRPGLLIPGVTVVPGGRAVKVGLHKVMVDLSSDGEKVLISGAGGTQPATVWDAQTGQVRRISNLYGTSWFTHNGKALISASGNLAKLTDLPTGTTISDYRGHPDTLRFAVVSPDENFVAAAGGQGQPLRVWNRLGSGGITTFPRPNSAAIGVSSKFSPDGTRMLEPGSDGIVREYDTNTGAMRRELTRFSLVQLPNSDKPTPVYSGFGYSHDGQQIYASAYLTPERTVAAIRVLDAVTGRLVQELPQRERKHSTAGFTADGKGLYVVDTHGGVGIWDLAAKTYRGAIAELHQIVAISPCGRYLFTDDTPTDAALPGRKAALRNAKTGKKVAELEGFPTVFSPDSIWLTACFSQDGERVAVACPDLKTRIWETRTGRLISTVRDFAGYTVKLDLAFNPDSTRLAAAGFGVQIWDVATGRAVIPLGQFRVSGQSVRFSTDGRTLLASGRGTTLLTRIRARQ